MTKMFLSSKKKKSTIETSDKKYGDVKCLDNNKINNTGVDIDQPMKKINHQNSFNNIVEIQQQQQQLQQHQQQQQQQQQQQLEQQQQVQQQQYPGYSVDQSIVLQNKNFNSKSQFAGASEIYGNNNMDKSPPVANKPFEQKHHSLKKMFKRVLDFNKKKDVDPKLDEFLKLVDYHREFFKRSPEIDRYVMTLAFIYIKKAFPNDTLISNELFFYSLYLAWETEEDSTLGLESIIHYIIGSYPSSKNKDKNQRKQEIIEWRMRLRQFHTGKDILWRALDYKTVVDFPHIQKTIKAFPNHDILKRERTSTTSIKFF
ncbi:hypothetical protein ACTFIR_003056 [Dictyostelium discoideum]